MLETPNLLLASWERQTASDAATVARDGRRRAILDADRGTPLGFARLRFDPGVPLLRWFHRPVLEVFEAPDASLVCTARGRWGRRWGVYDADERPVGGLRPGRSSRCQGGTLVEDPYGRALAWIPERPLDGVRELTRYRGAPYGTAAETCGGTVLRFDPSLDANPFPRMLLLAALATEGTTSL
jgi:hypothetical protein